MMYRPSNVRNGGTICGIVNRKEVAKVFCRALGLQAQEPELIMRFNDGVATPVNPNVAI